MEDHYKKVLEAIVKRINIETDQPHFMGLVSTGHLILRDDVLELIATVLPENVLEELN